MNIIRANDRAVLELGYEGERNRTEVRFYYGDLEEEFPGGTVLLQVKRPGECTKYDILLNNAEDEEYTAVWTVSEYDCAVKGVGECQLIYSVEGVTAKRKIWKTHFDRSIEGSNASIPPDWESIESSLLDAATAVRNAISEERSFVNAAREGAEAAQRAAEHALAQYDDMTASATQLPIGSQPTATMDHSGDAPELKLGIPKGDTGATPRISIGTVDTGVSGSSASVTITGTPEDPVLNFRIPMGNHGDTALLADSYVVDTGRRPVYEYNAYCVYDDKVYRCIMPIAEPEEFTPEHWEESKVLNEVMRYFKTTGSDVEFDKATQTLPLLKNEQQRLYMGLLVFTGMRREEIAGIGWEHIHLDDGYGEIRRTVVYPDGKQTVVREKTKTKKSTREFIIPDPLLDILKPLKKDSGYIIHGRSDDSPASFSTLRRIYRAAFKELGIKGYDNHDWRATFGTQLKDVGLSSAQVADLMGHADTRMVETTYAPTRHESLMKHKNTLNKIAKIENGSEVAPE